MRILHLDFDNPRNPQGGGQAIRTFEINRRLVKKHDITVVSMNFPGAKNYEKDGIQYEFVGLTRFPWNFFSYLWNIRKILKSHDYDLVIEDNIPPFTFGFSPFFTRKPVISSVQCLFARETSKKYFLPFFLIEKWAARFYKHFIALTQCAYERIKIMNPHANITIIPNGLSDEWFDVPRREEGDYLLYLGRVDIYHKGIDVLLEAFSRALKALPSMRLVIAGNKEPKDKGRFEQLLNKYHFNGQQVECVGFVRGKEKMELISGCRFVCMPSRYEIFPFVALEAFTCAKPVLCFDIENLNEVVTQDRGVLIRPFDIYAYAQSMVKLYSNENMRQSLGNNAYEWVKDYRWDFIAITQEFFYKKVIHNKNLP